MDIKGDETFLDEGSKAVLHVQSIGQVVYAFINGKLAGIYMLLLCFSQTVAINFAPEFLDKTIDPWL